MSADFSSTPDDVLDRMIEHAKVKFQDAVRGRDWARRQAVNAENLANSCADNLLDLRAEKAVRRGRK